jgi:hypothetical protein
MVAMLERAAESLIAAVDLIDAQSHRLKDTAVETARDATRSAAVAGGVALGMIGAVLIGGLALVVAGAWALAWVTNVPIAIAAAGGLCLLVGLIGLGVQKASSRKHSTAASNAATTHSKDGSTNHVDDTRISHAAAAQPEPHREPHPDPRRDGSASPHSTRDPGAVARANGRRAFGGSHPSPTLDGHRGQGAAPRSEPAATGTRGPAHG